MSSPGSGQDIILASLARHTLRLTPRTLLASAEHARYIASELGNNDVESSIAMYWDVESRLRQWRQILRRIGLEQAHGNRFVEVGSGMGLFVLVGRVLDLNITGVESSSDRYQNSLHIAQMLFEDNGADSSLVQATAEALPFPDASIDFVASFQTIEHVSDLSQTFREIRRILKPSGIFFAQAPNYASFYEAHYGLFTPLATGKNRTHHYLKLLGRPPFFLQHLNWITPNHLRTQLYDSGFSSVTISKVSTPAFSPDLFCATIYPLPFRARRGTISRRAAYGIAYLADHLHYSENLYPQLELWAIV